MDIYGIVDISTGLFESIVTFMLFDNFLARREKFSAWVYWLGVIALSAGLKLCNYIFSISILNMLFMIIAKFLISFLYKKNIKAQLALAVASFGISTFMEIIIMLLISVIKHADSYTVVHDPNLRVLGIMLSKTVDCAAVKLICIFSKRKLAKIRTGYWVVFLTNFSVAVLTTWLIFSYQSPDINPFVVWLSVICSLGLLYGVLATIYLYESMSAQSEKLKEKELSQQRLDMQIKHLNELVIAQKQARSVKHDLANHLILIKSYMADNKTDECKEYVDDLINYAGISSDVIDTGNLVIDAILTAKKNLAKSKDIDFITDIRIPEKLNMNSVDCCIIFGNALDNAIEACEKVQGDKYIKISLVYNKESLICKIVNSSAPVKNPLLKTTKDDKANHGLGFANIQTALEKYQHVMKAEQNGEEFSFFFVLYDVH